MISKKTDDAIASLGTQMSNILITGANGFIGSHLVDLLAASTQHTIYAIDLSPRVYEPFPDGVNYIQGDYRNSALVQQLLIDRGIDVVFHLAWTTINETSVKKPIADLEQNLVPTVQLLEACCMANVKRFVFVSTGGAVYGIPESVPTAENHPTNPISAYGINKLSVEKYLQMYAHLYNLEYIIFRPSVPYGPRQNPLRRQGAVAVFIFRTLLGEPITIWGDGESLRDYFYIDDLSRALVAATSNHVKTSRVINIAGMQGYTLNQLVAVIEDTLKISINVEYRDARKFDVPQLRLDTNIARRILNWQPEITLAEGIQKTANWIKKWVV